MHQKQCKGCDILFFVALRTDAVTCSPRCRQRYKRMCDRITAEAATADVPKCVGCGTGKDVVGGVCLECSRKIDAGEMEVA